MSESDSGVDTGSDSNESNSMSIESPPRIEEKEADDIAEQHDIPGVSHHQMAVPFVTMQPLYCSYGYSDYRQHEHTRKMKSSLQRKNISKWKRKQVYPKLYGVLGEWKLRNAVISNSPEHVKSLLELGVDPCASDEKDRTALHFAASLGLTEIASLLLQHGANPNQRDVLGNTPLHLAACTSHIQIVTLLLKAGTDVNAFNKSGRSPLHLAQSKLKVLQLRKSYTSTQLKTEVMQVVEMMQVYLHRSGQPSEVNLLNAFSNRLQLHQTREEVNHDVSELLSSLSHLSL